MSQTTCGWCQQTARTLHCSLCKRVYYCNGGCQKKHWVVHKLECGSGRKHGAIATVRELGVVLDALTLVINGDSERRASVIEIMGLHKPPDFLWSPYLEVRDSPIHGRGVFATRALPANTVLTGYPAHWLVIDGAVLQCSEASVDTSAENLAHITDVYGYPLSSGVRLCGLPSETGDKRLLGHMLNDASLCDVFSGTETAQLREKSVLRRVVMQYYSAVFANANCGFRSDRHGLMACVVSRREIKPNEELLLTYGLSYWLEKNHGAESTKRFPFIATALRELHEEDAEFRALARRSIDEFDRPAMTLF